MLRTVERQIHMYGSLDFHTVRINEQVNISTVAVDNSASPPFFFSRTLERLPRITPSRKIVLFGER